jgi:hypothetical protein
MKNQLCEISLEETILASQAAPISHFVAHDGKFLNETTYPALEGDLVCQGMRLNLLFISVFKISFEGHWVNLPGKGRRLFFEIDEDQIISNVYINNLLGEINEKMLICLNQVVNSEKEFIIQLESKGFQASYPYTQGSKGRTCLTVEQQKELIFFEIERSKDELLQIDNLIVENNIISLYEFLKDIEICEKELYTEIFKDFSEEIHAFSLLLADRMYSKLRSKEHAGLLQAYNRLTDFHAVQSQVKRKYEPSGEVAKMNQERSIERFEEVKSLSRKWAKDSWDEEATLRYGVIASGFHKAIKDNYHQFGLNSCPAISTIKSWIKDLAPSEDCLKGGRPNKN